MFASLIPLVAMAGLALCAPLVPPAYAQGTAADCPNNGTVRFGVEPFEAAAKLIPIYDHVGDLLGKKLGCKVRVFITNTYTAEIEAMRSGKLELGSSGRSATCSPIRSPRPRRSRLSPTRTASRRPTRPASSLGRAPASTP